jgi:hypothetical protein
MKIFEITAPTLDMSNPVGFIRSMQKSLGMNDGTGGLTLSNAKGKVTDPIDPTDNDVVEPEASNEVVIIGDSIAAGMGGEAPYAKSGLSTTEVLKRVNAFIKTGKAKGSVVILSSGASNSAPVELEGGTSRPGKLDPVAQQLKALKDAGASVALVGTGSKKSAWFPPTKYTDGKRYRVDLTNVNQQLASMASANGAKFLGALEEFDNSMHSGKGDGVHPFRGYQKLKQAGSEIAPVSQPATTPSKQPATKNKSSTGGKGTVNPGEIQSYLSSKGLDRNQVAGIMANIKAESSFRPGAIGDNGTSGGLFQHHKERFSAMSKAAGPNWQTNWKGQIDFALSEPAGRKYASMKFATPEEASKWFTINFERPANMVAKANSRSLDASQFA